MVRWLRWHCPPDTGFEIRALAVWGRARYLSVTEAPRTPDSGVKGSGANHYPRAPALFPIYVMNNTRTSLTGWFVFYQHIEYRTNRFIKRRYATLLRFENSYRCILLSILLTVDMWMTKYLSSFDIDSNSAMCNLLSASKLVLCV